MKERGMIFNAEMVRALLDGRKTQTRRHMKIQPILEEAFVGGHKKLSWIYKNIAGPDGWLMHELCPFGAVGDHIWVRETFSIVPDHDESVGCSAVLYAADGAKPHGKWTASLHMPREHSRILLEITDVRVERLNAISEQDAQAEGVATLRGGFWKHYQPGWTQHQLSARSSFVTLWNSIYGDDSWNADPWVWVIEFKRIEGATA